MELRINRTAFLKGLYYAQSIADRRSTTPAVANVLLRSHGPDTIVCAATDLRISMVAQIPAEVRSEGGVSVGAKHLYEIVRSLADTELTISRAENNWVEISAAKARYRLVGLADRDFPQLPDHQEIEFKEVTAATLSDLISKTIFSVSNDDTRPHLAGILFESNGEVVKAISTDGHRLTLVQHEWAGGPVLRSGVVIPRKGLLELRRLLESVEGSCDIGFGRGCVFVRVGDVVVSVALVEAQFPPYDRVVPHDNDKRLVLDRVTFLEALKRASIMSSERSWGIRMELENQVLRITSENPDLGEAREELEVDYTGEKLTIGFNARYFIDVLNEMRDDEICLELSGELDPGLLRPRDSHDYLGVIMPMRI